MEGLTEELGRNFRFPRGTNKVGKRKSAEIEVGTE